YSSAVGSNNTASGDYSSALGVSNKASGEYSSAVGYWSDASGNNSSAVGFRNAASGEYSSAVGYNNKATGEYAQVFGGLNNYSGDNSKVTVGRGAVVLGYRNNYADTGEVTVGANAVAVGVVNTTSASRAVGVGINNTLNSGTSASAFGQDNAASGQSSVAVGNSNKAQGQGSSVFGYNSQAVVDYGTAIGYQSYANRAAGVQGLYVPTNFDTLSTKDKAIWQATSAALAVGDPNGDGNSGNPITRQITGVAAGLRDTDAVNVAQLKEMVISAGGFAPITVLGNTGTGISVGSGGTLNIQGDGTNITTKADAGKITIGLSDELDKKIADKADKTELDDYAKLSNIQDDSNNITATVSGDTVTIGMKDEINLTSVNTGGVTMSGTGLAMNNQKITGLAQGTADTDAVNVKQMNTAITNAGAAALGAINGGTNINKEVTATGIKFNLDPDINLTSVNTGGVKMSAGGLAMNSQKITGLADGTADTDAVNLGQLKAAGIGVCSYSSTGGLICGGNNSMDKNGAVATPEYNVILGKHNNYSKSGTVTYQNSRYGGVSIGAANNSTEAAGTGPNFTIGMDSVAIGLANYTPASHSVAIGVFNRAEGRDSVAIGHTAHATKGQTVAIGNETTASNVNASALGTSNKASGEASSAVGYGNKADGGYSSALGSLNVASGLHSSAVGYNNQATGNGSIAIGENNKAISVGSFAFGYGNEVNGQGSSAFGDSNKVTAALSS
ncbi:MAG: hypothetical protein J6T41_00325, partial [Neisseriaceae bacterium]|nr:hypothetical protein [Neisseriaceae bacterium]